MLTFYNYKNDIIDNNLISILIKTNCGSEKNRFLYEQTKSDNK